MLIRRISLFAIGLALSEHPDAVRLDLLAANQAVTGNQQDCRRCVQERIHRRQHGCH